MSPTARVSTLPSHWPSRHPSFSWSLVPSEAASLAPLRHANLWQSPSQSVIPPLTVTPAGVPSLHTQRSVVPDLTVLLVATLSVVALLIAAFVNLVRQWQQYWQQQVDATIQGGHPKSHGQTSDNYDDLDDATFVRTVIQDYQQAKANDKLNEKNAKHIPPTEIMVITDAIAVEVNTADNAIISLEWDNDAISVAVNQLIMPYGPKRFNVFCELKSPIKCHFSMWVLLIFQTFISTANRRREKWQADSIYLYEYRC